MVMNLASLQIFFPFNVYNVDIENINTVDRKSEINLYTTPHHIKQEHAHLGNTLVNTIIRVKSEHGW